MSVFDSVFGSLRVMGLTQLLLAFIACACYALAQGAMLAGRARRVAWGVAVTAAGGFLFQSDDWTDAVMLIAFAVAGLGLFVAFVWLISRLVGVTATAPMPIASASGSMPLSGVTASRPAPEHAPSAGTAG